MHTPTFTIRRFNRPLIGILLAIALVGASCGGDDASISADAIDAPDTSATESTDIPAEDTASAPETETAPEQPVATHGEAPFLEAIATITPPNTDENPSVALSPDGTQVAILAQDSGYTAATLSVYDSQTGALITSIDLNADNPHGRIHWIADGRLTAREAVADRWVSWDSTSLEETNSAAINWDCDGSDQIVDQLTGASYSTEGISSLGPTICRFDTLTGAVSTAPPVAETTRIRGYWLQPTNEIVVSIEPEDGFPGLITLDSTTMQSVGDPVQFDEYIVVETVGAGSLRSDDNGRFYLAPLDLDVPYLQSPKTSAGGKFFFGSDDSYGLLVLSAETGEAVGQLPEGMNPTFGEWSLDDTTFAMPQTDGTVNIYRIG